MVIVFGFVGLVVLLGCVLCVSLGFFFGFSIVNIILFISVLRNWGIVI